MLYGILKLWKVWLLISLLMISPYIFYGISELLKLVYSYSSEKLTNETDTHHCENGKDITVKKWRNGGCL
jgi:hypothetical protein